MAREKLRKAPKHISTATYKGSRKQSNKGHVWDQNLEPYKTKPFHFEPNRTMFAPNPTRLSTIRFDSLTFQLDSSPRGPSKCLLWTELLIKMERLQGGAAVTRAPWVKLMPKPSSIKVPLRVVKSWRFRSSLMSYDVQVRRPTTPSIPRPCAKMSKTSSHREP